MTEWWFSVEGKY